MRQCFRVCYPNTRASSKRASVCVEMTHKRNGDGSHVQSRVGRLVRGNESTGEKRIALAVLNSSARTKLSGGTYGNLHCHCNFDPKARSIVPLGR
jgi:hypothetical protein